MVFAEFCFEVDINSNNQTKRINRKTMSFQILFCEFLHASNQFGAINELCYEFVCLFILLLSSMQNRANGEEFILSFVPAVSLEWLVIKHILCQLSASTETAS